jgi:hypothetical protein
MLVTPFPSDDLCSGAWIMNGASSHSHEQRVCGMKNKHQFLMLVFAVVLSIAPITGYAQKSSTNEDTQNIFIPDFHKQASSGHTWINSPEESYGYQGFNVHVWNNYDPKGSSAVNSSSVYYSGQMGLLQMAAGFANYLFSSHLMSASSEDSLSQEVFMAISLDTLLSPSLTITKDIGNSKQLSALLKLSPVFEINENIRLKPDITASYIRRDVEANASTRYSDPVLKPFIHNPFHNGAVSISLPITITRSLTISPAITYAFSINSTNNQEYKGKSLINGIDKDSAIVYTGIHLIYKF